MNDLGIIPDGCPSENPRDHKLLVKEAEASRQPRQKAGLREQQFPPPDQTVAKALFGTDEERYSDTMDTIREARKATQETREEAKDERKKKVAEEKKRKAAEELKKAAKRRKIAAPAVRSMADDDDGEANDDWFVSALQ